MNTAGATSFLHLSNVAAPMVFALAALALSVPSSAQFVPPPPVIAGVTAGTRSVWVELANTYPYGSLNMAVTCGGQTVYGYRGPFAIFPLTPSVPVTCTAVALSASGGSNSDPSAPSSSVTPLDDSTAPQGPTLLYIHSRPGDPILMGMPFNATSTNGSDIFLMESNDKVWIGVDNPFFAQKWGVFLQAPNGGPLTAGSYANTGYQAAYGNAGLNFSRLGLGSGDQTGKLDILELVRDQSGKIQSLAANFEIRQGYLPPPIIYGQLRFRSTVPADPTRHRVFPFSFNSLKDVAVGTVVTSNPVPIYDIDVPLPISVSGAGEYRIDNGTYTTSPGTVQNGQNVTLRVTAPAVANAVVNTALTVGDFTANFGVATSVGNQPQPTGANLIVLINQASALNPNNYVGPIQYFSSANFDTFKLGDGLTLPQIDVVRPANSSSIYKASFAGPDGAPLVIGTYLGARDNPGPGQPRMSTTAYYSYSCAVIVSADMNVLDVAYAADGTLARLALDFVANYAENSSACARTIGHVRINSSVPINYNVALPYPFKFAPVVNQAPNALAVSAAATIRGINVAVPISVTGGEYSINSGPFTAMPGTIQDGQSVQVRRNAAATENTLVSARLNVGGVEADFRVGTRTSNTQPQPAGEPLAVFVSVSNSSYQPFVTQVFTPATSVSIGFGQQNYNPSWASFSATRPGVYSQEYMGVQFAGPNGTQLSPGVYTNPTSNFYAGAVALSVGVSSGCNNSPVARKMTIHEVEYGAQGQPVKLAMDFVLDCGSVALGYSGVVLGYIRFNSALPIDYTNTLPVALQFTSFRGAVPGSSVTSNSVYVRGINTVVPISVVGGEYSLDGGPYTAAPGFVVADQQVSLRVAAPASYGNSTSATLTVGGRSATFLVATATAPQVQPTGSPLVVLMEQRNDGGFNRTAYESSTLFDITLSLNQYFGETMVVYVKSAPGVYDYNNWYYELKFGGPNGTRLVPGTYTGVIVNGGNVAPPILSGTTCPYFNAYFVVHEVEFAANGEPVKLAADFVSPCKDWPFASAVFGYVRFNSTFPIDYSIRRPAALVFTPALGVAPGSMQESNEITVVGITVDVPVSVTGGEYSVDGGPYTSVASILSAGQRVRVRVPAPMLGNALATVRLDIGEGSANFNVGTALGTNPQASGLPYILMQSAGAQSLNNGRDLVLSPATLSTITASATGGTAVSQYLTVRAVEPNFGSPREWFFAFGPKAGSPLVPGRYTNTRPDYWSDGSYPLLGVGVFNACYSANANNEFTLQELELNGTQVVKLAVDFIYYCGTNADASYGFIRINSSVPVNAPADTTPAQIYFSGPSFAPPNTLQVCNEQVLSGFNQPLPISIAGGEYSLDGGAFTATPGTAMPGQRVRVRLMSSPAYNAGRYAALMVGGMTENCNVFTMYDPAADTRPDSFDFGYVYGVPQQQWVLSPVLTLSGTAATSNYLVSGGEISVGGRAFTSSNGQIAPGETMQVRAMTAAGDASANVRVEIGGVVGYFYVSSYLSKVGIVLNGNGTVTPSPVGTGCIAGISPVTCSYRYPAGTALTLTPIPAAGHTFIGWSGACVGTGICSITTTYEQIVTATFLPSLPLAPISLAAIPGDGQATLTFSAPGGAGPAVSAYVATCQPGNVNATATNPPITVTGLTNGTAYSCSVAAVSSAGTGASSTAVTVTPTSALTFNKLGVYSRKTHGTAGIFNLEIDDTQPIGGDITIEPRITGAGHTIVVQFNAPVTSVGQVTAVDGAGAAVTIASTVMSGSELIVTLGMVPDKTRVKITVTGINGTMNVSAALGFLVGDINESRSVAPDDLSAVKSRAGQVAGSDNFRADVNASGKVSASDVSTVKTRIGNTLQ